MATINQTPTDVVVTLGSSSVRVLLFGATVISWIVEGKEQFWVSAGTTFDGSAAVRGGIPLVFPIFGPPSPDHKPTADLPAHGFARVSKWELLGKTDDSADKVTVQFGLGPENVREDLRSKWAYDFSLIYSVTLTKDTLSTKLSVENTDTKPFDFKTLFHTYFKIPDISQASVTNLKDVKVNDKVSKTLYTASDDEVHVAGEVDRVYQSVPPKEVELKLNGKPTIVVERTPEIVDVVVWNPWIAKAERTADFLPKDGYKQMICVEVGKVAEFATLAPGKTWEGGQTLKAVL